MFGPASSSAANGTEVLIALFCIGLFAFMVGCGGVFV
jgi:hypothetical protein